MSKKQSGGTPSIGAKMPSFGGAMGTDTNKSEAAHRP